MTQRLLSYCIIILCLPLLSFAKSNIWIDYDIAIGKKVRDVDDGFTLVHVLTNSNTLELKGVSGVYGNISDMDFMKEETHRIFSFFDGTEIPFHPGAISASQLGQTTSASQALTTELEKGPLTVVATGRMTNIATVLMQRTELAKNIRELVIIAGRRIERSTAYGPRKIIFPDTNIDGDVAAVKIIIKNRIAVVMIPVEAMMENIMTGEHLDQLKDKGGVFRYISKNSWFWLKMFRTFIGGKGFIPWDLFAATYLTHPQDFACYRNIPYGLKWMKNDTHSLFRPNKPKEKDFLVASYDLESKALGTYCYSIKETHLQSVLDGWGTN